MIFDFNAVGGDVAVDEHRRAGRGKTGGGRDPAGREAPGQSEDRNQNDQRGRARPIAEEAAIGRKITFHVWTLLLV